MRAIVRKAFGGPEQLAVKDLPLPVPAEGEVRIQVKAFGINRAETYMRKGAWGDVVDVSGIECVGIVDLDPSGRLPRGQTVAAIMGGLGRTRPGSYAEYTCAPASNVFALHTTLPWTELAAVPESFATAWWCLFVNLKLEQGHTLLVRGAASALGQAAVNIASDLGATVIATTRSEKKRELLFALGASSVLIESPELGATVRTNHPAGIDRVLDLVGNSVLKDSLRALRPHGKYCQAGFLGGADPVEKFNPIFDLPSDVEVSFFGSFVLGSDGFSPSRIPMQQIVNRVAQGRYKAKPARVFQFEAVPEAHRLMEANGASGKIVVEV